MKPIDKLENTVFDSWKLIPPPEAKDLEYLGGIFAKKYSVVPPIDVDLDDNGFSSINQLLDFKPHTSAVYLGAYLLDLIASFKIQQKLNFPVDISRRADTISTLSYPTFWVEVAKPNLPPQCLSAIGEVAAFLLENKIEFVIGDDQELALIRLMENVARG